MRYSLLPSAAYMKSLITREHQSFSSSSQYSCPEDPGWAYGPDRTTWVFRQCMHMNDLQAKKEMQVAVQETPTVG